MLTDSQLFHVKRQAGMRLILELGLTTWSDESMPWNDPTEVVVEIVHDEIMNFIAYHWPKGQTVFMDSVLDQEWELVNTLSDDLGIIFRLYREGKLKLEVSIR